MQPGPGYSSFPMDPQAVYGTPPRSPEGRPQSHENDRDGRNEIQMIYIPRMKTSEDSLSDTNFDDKRIRSRFIRKVYFILFSQLLLTGSFVLLCTQVALFFALYIILVCCPSVRRNFPGNYFALSLFTIVFAYLSGAMACSYSTHAIISTIGITGVTCLFVSILASTSCMDLTKWGGVITVISIAFILFGVTVGMSRLFLGHNKMLHMVYGGIAACLFVVYLAFDTQMILGGRSHEIDEEDYIFAALQLYLDMMAIFLVILGLYGKE